ncbi:MAG: RIP metalloprotease RseP [Tissierellia bacterium]|nr:RIP metalloprotease RseP [Tissierellia bacterium]
MQVILGLIMFMFLILVHEFGHFAIAKLSGIKVNEFSIGMGPKLVQFKKKETDYTIRLLPLGGYVAMEGEDEASNDPRSYKNAKAYKRFMTILAGPLMNLLTAFLIFIVVFSMTGAASLVVESVDKSMPAYEAGLMENDKIIKVNGKETTTFSQVSDHIDKYPDQVKLTVLRDGKEVELKEIQAKEADGAYIIGFSVKTSKDFSLIIREAYNRVIFIMALLWNTLGMLFSGQLGMQALSGPVGVINQVGTAAKMGAETLLVFLAIISINLGFFNLLPIPALDGSKLLFIIIEKIIGKPINQKIEERVTMVGFVLLLLLIVVVSVKDIVNLFN